MGQGIEIDQLEQQAAEEQLEDSAYASSEIQKEIQQLEDPEWIQSQKAYLRKLDFIILPVISAFYFFEYLDRGNIAVSCHRPRTVTELIR
jgi:hypothetical protein